MPQSKNNPLNKLSAETKRKLDIQQMIVQGRPSTLPNKIREATIQKMVEHNLQSLANIDADVRRNMLESLLSAVRDGRSVSEAAAYLIQRDEDGHGPFAQGRHRAVLIAKTEIKRGIQLAVLDQYTNEGWDYFVWLSIRAANTCPRCLERHNVYHKLHVWENLGLAPLHAGCFCSLVPGYRIPENQVP